MTSVIYASALAVLLCVLALNVIKNRRKHQVAYADGGVKALQIARTAHGNAVDYIPITLLLLFALEYNGAPLWLVHVAGITFLAGRLIHARGILQENFKGRVLGMQLTIWTILALAAANLLFLPYARLLGQ